MNLWDVLILACVAAALLFAVRRVRKNRRPGCCGSCAGCPGCAGKKESGHE